MLGPGDLVLSSYTVHPLSPGGGPRSPYLPFGDYLAAASDAGFRGISLSYADYHFAREEGLSDADMRSLLEEHGLEIAELEAVADWGLGGEAGVRSRAREQRYYAIAEALGARSLLAVSDLEDPLELVVERFAALCDRAAQQGLLVALEFLPWSTIADAATAEPIVRLADRPNGGLLVDSWHYYRGTPDPAALRAAGGARIVGVQLNDAPLAAEADVLDESLHRRLMPGAGELDVVGLVRLLDELGVEAPIGVEVFSDALAERPAADVARLAAEATRRLLAAARAPSVASSPQET